MTTKWLLAAALAVTACKSGTTQSKIKDDGGAPAVTGDDRGAGDYGDRKERLAKLRKANRLFQVYLDREVNREKELDDWLGLGIDDVHRKLAGTEEARSVLGARIARFLKEKGAEPKQGGVGLNMTPAQLVPDEGRLQEGANGARLCGESADNGVCFTQWLIEEAAPGLVGVWSPQEVERLAAKTYGEILGMLADKSLEF